MVVTLNKQIILKIILLTIVIGASSCSSVRVTNESVVEEGVRGVTTVSYTHLTLPTTLTV